MSYPSRAERWALRVLDAVFADRSPRRSRRYGADDLRRMIDSSPRVAGRFQRLRAIDDLLSTITETELADRGIDSPPVQESLRSVGPFTFSEAEAPRTFERRVSTLWEQEADPLKDTSYAWPTWIGVGAAAAAALLVFGGESPAEPDEFAPRGAADIVPSSLVVTPYCLLSTDGDDVQTRAISPAAPCPTNARIATSVTDTAGRDVAVVLLGVQSSPQRLNLLPYSPSPSAPNGVRLEVGATEQRIGPVRRLETNHDAGRLDVVAISLAEPADWSEVEPVLTEILDQHRGATAEYVAGAIFDAFKRTGMEPVEFTVTRSALAVP